MRRGFTLVEILAVIALMAVLVLIAVPTYITISGTMKENVYNAKIEEIKAKSTTYAQETGKVVFSVDTLISEGRITPDNETGVYKDPRSDRKMNCDIIHISFNDNQYEVSIEESETCYSDEELNNRYGIARLKVVDDQGNEIPSIEGTEWLGVSNVYVTYEIKEEYQDYASNIVGVEWSGEETLSCTSENLTECKRYSVSTTSVKMLTVNFKLTIESNGANIISNYSKNVYLDIVAPEIKEGSILLENEYNTNSERRVRFELTDYNGSGVKEYALVKEKTCTGSEYEANKKNANEGVQTEYLNNGTYYVCVKDKVGNKTPDSELDNNKIEVSNVDNGSPSVSLSINSKDSRYHTKEVTLNINASDNEGTTNLKMCISNTGYLQDCSWESYTNSKNWTLSGDYDGGTRKVYITIQDASGNIGQNESSYTVYKSCTTTTKNYTDSNYGTCSKACGGGVQYRNYQLKDTYLGTVCSTGRDQRSCNTTSCCSQTEDYSWGAWSSCSKTCGGGTQTRTVYKRSTIDRSVTCGSYQQTQSCNNQSCAPTVTRVGNYLEGLLSPLNSTQFVEFDSGSDKTCGGRRSCSGGCSTSRCSWVNGRIINVNGTSVSYGPTQSLTRADDGTSTKNNGNGIGDTVAVRLDDNTIAFAGGNYKSDSKVSLFATMIIKTSGNSMWVSQNLGGDTFNVQGVGSYSGGLEGLYHTTGSPLVYMHYECGTKTKYRFCYVAYNYTTATIADRHTGEKHDYLIDYHYDKEGRAGRESALPRHSYQDYISLSNGTGVTLEPPVSINNVDVIATSSWSDYGSARAIQHFGNDKLIILTVDSERINGSYVYTPYFIFYRNINGSWVREHVLVAPGANTRYYTGEFVALNNNTVVYNSRNNGLYVIQYN